MTDRTCWALPVLLLLAACGGDTGTQEGAAQGADTLAAVDTVPGRIDYTEPNGRLHATLGTGTCTEWKQRGDSLHTWLGLVTERLDRMRVAMERRPIDDATIADSVYLANGDGEHAYADLRTFYGIALRSAADIATLERAEGLAMQVLSFPTAEAWRQRCFTRQARMTSSTILSKITSDALLLESMCLRSILKECERSVGGSPFPVRDSL